MTQLPIKSFSSIHEFLEISNLLPSSDALVLEALTHSSVKKHYNHEQLEFFGDAVLRLAASEFIRNVYPTMDVGQQSSLRSQLVSDSWLANFGEIMNIDELILKGSDAMHDVTAIKTIRAEMVEAVAGAVYIRQQTTKNIILLFKAEWEMTAEKFLQNPYHFNCKSALQEWSQSHQLGLPNYTTIEQSKLHGDDLRFKSIVIVSEQLEGEGWGRSRKEAEQSAAKNCLQRLDAQ